MCLGCAALEFRFQEPLERTRTTQLASLNLRLNLSTEIVHRHKKRKDCKWHTHTHSVILFVRNVLLSWKQDHKKSRGPSISTNSQFLVRSKLPQIRIASADEFSFVMRDFCKRLRAKKGSFKVMPLPCFGRGTASPHLLLNQSLVELTSPLTKKREKTLEYS